MFLIIVQLSTALSWGKQGFPWSQAQPLPGNDNVHLEFFIAVPHTGEKKNNSLALLINITYYYYYRHHDVNVHDKLITNAGLKCVKFCFYTPHADIGQSNTAKDTRAMHAFHVTNQIMTV